MNVCHVTQTVIIVVSNHHRYCKVVLLSSGQTVVQSGRNWIYIYIKYINMYIILYLYIYHFGTQTGK